LSAPLASRAPTPSATVTHPGGGPRLFTERGDEVQLPEVARAAGVGVGTVYRHFASQRELVEAAAELRFAEIAEFAGTVCLTEADRGRARPVTAPRRECSPPTGACPRGRGGPGTAAVSEGRRAPAAGVAVAR